MEHNESVCLCIMDYTSRKGHIFSKGNKYNYFKDVKNEIHLLFTKDYDTVVITHISFSYFFIDLQDHIETQLNVILDDK